jgi:hypothetical protein
MVSEARSGAGTKMAERVRPVAAMSAGDLGASFERVAPTGERFVPHRFSDGMFRVADPTLGRTKHHAANQIAIRTDEIAAYLKRGFLLRMRGERSGQVNLIAASEIVAS